MSHPTQQVMNRVQRLSGQISMRESNSERDNRDTENNLERIYNNIKIVPNYSSKITDFLRQNEIHSLHRRIVKKTFPRRRIITEYPFQIFQADLIDYSQRRLYLVNKGYRYILIIIDCFSKVVYSHPVKRKNADYMSDAFQMIFDKLDNYPNSIITDQGLEFYNSKVQQVFNHFNINHYHTKTKTKWKASMAERVIRTLKSRLEKYFYKNKTLKWVDIFSQIVENYNNTPHRTIGMAPNQVTEENSQMVYNKVFKDIDLKIIPRLRVGDKVRILIEKSLFQKGYTQNWSKDIYTVKNIFQRGGVAWYKLVGPDNKTLPGIRYYWQLNFISRDAGPPSRFRNKN